MIDFHTHILPGIDDGSQSVEESIELIKLEIEQGVRSIVFTPHFYAHKMSMEGFLKKREQAYERLVKAMKKDNLQVNTVCGAEVYYFSGIGTAREIAKLTIGNTNLLLLEMPFSQWDQKMLKDVKDLIYRQKLTVILAHLERYEPYQRDKSIWKQIFELPVIIQLNGGNFARLLKTEVGEKQSGGFFGKIFGKQKKTSGGWDERTKFCVEFVKERPHILLGSDCHNLRTRTPNVGKAREGLAHAIGEGSMLELLSYGKSMEKELFQ